MNLKTPDSLRFQEADAAHQKAIAEMDAAEERMKQSAEYKAYQAAIQRWEEATKYVCRVWREESA